MAERWVWIKVPLRAITAAIDALKERVARGHIEASQVDDSERGRRRRAEADDDDAYAEALKRAVRDEKGPPRGPD